MDEVIKYVIRKWLEKYNYLFSPQEIADLSSMISSELSHWDWADMHPDAEKEILARIIKEGR